MSCRVRGVMKSAREAVLICGPCQRVNERVVVKVQEMLAVWLACAVSCSEESESTVKPVV